MDYNKEYDRWLSNVLNQDLLEELRSMDEAQIEDAFYRDLAFGTGGLRGTIGAGTNRMNIYVVAKASQGLSKYLLEHFESPSVVIGYDSRIKSDVFARTAAGVFAANGITVHFWPQLLPVPTVSFATRELNASAGVMITASHNPSKYNGYKVYGADGCQITTEAAKAILAEINALDIFADVKYMDFEEAVAAGKVKYIPETVLDCFIAEVKGQSVLYGDEIDRDRGKLGLEIPVIAQMQLIAQIVAEYRHFHAGLYVLEQPQRLDVDVVIDDVYQGPTLTNRKLSAKHCHQHINTLFCESKRIIFDIGTTSRASVQGEIFVP